MKGNLGERSGVGHVEIGAPWVAQSWPEDLDCHLLALRKFQCREEEHSLFQK